MLWWVLRGKGHLTEGRSVLPKSSEEATRVQHRMEWSSSHHLIDAPSFSEYDQFMSHAPRSQPVAALDHIGIAVSNLPELTRLFKILGLGVDHEEAVPEQGVNTHFVPLPIEQTNLEFLEVTDPAGTVAKFIEKRGPGIHHLAFRVRYGELDALCARLKGEGIRLIYPEPKPGAHEMRVNFIHPQSAGGMLVEVMEPAHPKKD